MNGGEVLDVFLITNLKDGVIVMQPHSNIKLLSNHRQALVNSFYPSTISSKTSPAFVRHVHDERFYFFRGGAFLQTTAQNRWV